VIQAGQSGVSWNNLVLQPSGSNVGIGVISPVHLLELSTDSAAKPSTTGWTIYSDIRLKRNVRPFVEGLETIRQIKPIRFQYNGQGGIRNDGRECVGLDAGAHNGLLPDCVSFNPLTQYYEFNSHALTFMLINAFKELTERIERLEAK
jgi:hypothetical protein